MEINVLIIDDDAQNVREIKQGLISLGANQNNIFPEEGYINNISEKISNYAMNQEYEIVYRKLKSLIKKEDIDILFLDLNLSGNESSQNTSGQKIIELFTSSKEQFLSELPIVVVSQYSKEELPKGLIQMIPYLHIKKSTSFDRNEFKRTIETTKLNIIWDSIINRYQKIKTNSNYQNDLDYVKSKLEQINYHDKLNSIIDTLDTIEINVAENNEKLQTLEIFGKSIIKTLPLLANKVQVQKVLLGLEDDKMDVILGDEFPSNLKVTLYSKIKAIAQQETDDLTDSLIENIKKEIQEYIGKEANFNEQDNIVEKTGKLTLYIYNKIING